MRKLYKEDKWCDAEEDQVSIMEEAGWSKDAPQEKSVEKPVEVEAEEAPVEEETPKPKPRAKRKPIKKAE